MGFMKTFWGDREGQGDPDPSKKEKGKKTELTLSAQPISGKFYTCFPLFFPKVEFLISLSALSRLLDWFPQEEKHSTTRECAAFTSFAHPCTLCQTRVAVWLRGVKRCSPARMCPRWSEKRRIVWLKRGSLNFSPHTQTRAHSPGFACVGNDCPYCRLLWSFPTRLCYASDSALQRLEYMRIHDPHVKALEKFRCVCSPCWSTTPLRAAA